MPTTCPSNKVVNPATGRCVKRDGKIGKSILGTVATKKPTLAQVTKLFQEVHPDSYMSADAKRVFQTMFETKTEKQVQRIMDLAGDVARYEDKKKTSQVDHITRAEAYIANGRVKQAKRKHEAARKAWIESLNR